MIVHLNVKVMIKHLLTDTVKEVPPNKVPDFQEDIANLILDKNWSEVSCELTSKLRMDQPGVRCIDLFDAKEFPSSKLSIKADDDEIAQGAKKPLALCDGPASTSSSSGASRLDGNEAASSSGPRVLGQPGPVPDGGDETSDVEVVAAAPAQVARDDDAALTPPPRRAPPRAAVASSDEPAPRKRHRVKG